MSGKVLYVMAAGGADQMKVKDEPRPDIAPDQVLVNVRACGINFAELMARQGMYSKKVKYPSVLGFEGAGDIVAVGENVKGRKVGERVICMASDGMWREFAAVPEDHTFLMPEELTYEEGAAIPVNYMTAYHMLFDMGNLRPGKSVLVHMVAGGVGNAAVQLCRSIPDVTIFGTCSAAKHGVMKAAGVDHCIDYRTQDYVAEVRKVSPKGVDIVLDPLSGADSGKAFNLLKPLGKVIHFGAANIMTGQTRNLWQAAKTWWATASYNSLSMMTSNKMVAGYHLGFLIDHPETIKEAMEALIALYREGKIRPVIDSVWAFEDVAKAMGRMHERKNVGKVVISPQKEVGSEDIRAKV